MSKRICGRCGSTDIEENSLRGEVIWCNCNRCKYFAKVADFPEQSLFDRITQSPEVLAPKFVYNKVYMECEGDLSYWVSSYFSTIIPGKSWEYEAEAIAATLAKLKEVVE